jgi:hypothetical protein
MNYSEFQSKVLEGKEWSSIRTIGWEIDKQTNRRHITTIGEFEGKSVAIRKGKEIAAHVRKFYYDNDLEHTDDVTFERVYSDEERWALDHPEEATDVANTPALFTGSQIRLSGGIIEAIKMMLNETDVGIGDTLTITEGEMVIVDKDGKSVIGATRILNGAKESWFINDGKRIYRV